MMTKRLTAAAAASKWTTVLMVRAIGQTARASGATDATGASGEGKSNLSRLYPSA
jgi:hypothetical protein